MVPVNTLTVDFVAPKVHDSNDVDCDFFVGRRNPGQNPVHLFGMCKCVVNFIDNNAVTYDTMPEFARDVVR